MKEVPNIYQSLIDLIKAYTEFICAQIKILFLTLTVNYSN